MNVEFFAPARAEFAEVVRYYETERPGLEDEFAADVRRTIERIMQSPEAWSLLSRRTRRCPTNRFPYGIIYQVRGDSLLIMAVMHLHRAPLSWRARFPRSEQ